VILFNYLTLNQELVEGKRVAFQVINPFEVTVAYRSTLTNAPNFTIPYAVPPEEVIGTVSVLERTLWDTLTFKVGWLVEITEIQITNVFGESAMAFRHGESAYFNVTVDNITFINKMVALTITVYDVVNCSIGNILLNNWVIPPGNLNVVFEFQVPM
jgi:hypothetical protein